MPSMPAASESSLCSDRSRWTDPHCWRRAQEFLPLPMMVRVTHQGSGHFNVWWWQRWSQYGNWKLTFSSWRDCLMATCNWRSYRWCHVCCRSRSRNDQSLLGWPAMEKWKNWSFFVWLSPWWSGLRRRIWSTSPPRTCRLSCTSFHPGRLLQRNAVNIVIVSSFALNLFCPEFVRSCKWNIESGGREGGSSNSWQHFVQNCTIVSKSGERVGFYQNCIRIVTELYQNCIRIVSSLSGIVPWCGRKGAERLDSEKPGTITDFRSISDNIWFWWQYLVLTTIFTPCSNIDDKTWSWWQYLMTILCNAIISGKNAIFTMKILLMM